MRRVMFVCALGCEKRIDFKLFIEVVFGIAFEFLR